jgi:hypothetical protein
MADPTDRKLGPAIISGEFAKPISGEGDLTWDSSLTDRQRAKAKARHWYEKHFDTAVLEEEIAVVRDLAAFWEAGRREGWDAGREAAAKAAWTAIQEHRTNSDLDTDLRCVAISVDAAIHALPPPEAPAAQDASDKEEK